MKKLTTIFFTIFIMAVGALIESCNQQQDAAETADSVVVEPDDTAEIDRIVEPSNQAAPENP